MDGIGFLETEKKMELLGKIKKIEDKIEDEMFFVWYEINGEKRFIPATMSYTKEGAKGKIKNIEDLINKGAIPKCEYGVGKVNSILSDFSFISDKPKGAFIGRNMIKEASAYMEKAAHFVKPKLAPDPELWNKLCLEEIVITDTETTGISLKDEVVDLAAVRVKNFVIVDQFQSYIIPTVNISPEAFSVHGLSLQFLKEKGRPAKEVYEDFKKWLGNTPITGHNVIFDKGKIENHAKKVGLSFNLQIIFDTLQMSRRFMSMENHKLDGIVDRLGLREGLKSHSALDDVIAALRYCVVLRQLYALQHHPTTPLF